ncbi:VPS35 endosomal protein-sorting factor-like [Ptychodera flava]|uniref:VPS35 endosomal protein-sorting factor-like n=1 Tax=Ptychodera flava TaxID=63121 RepID=UPI00396A7150
MAAYEWHPRSRSYEKEKQSRILHGDPVTDHPLKPLTITVTESKIKKTGKGGSKQDSNVTTTSDPLSSAMDGTDPLSSALDGTDPLSAFADPLSQAAAEAAFKKTDTTAKKKTSVDDDFEPWSVKKAGILSKYTTSEKLSITTSFLSAADKEKVVVKTQVAQSTVSDKVKHRLEQLDDFEEGSVKEMLNLSQQDYVHRIDELNQAMISAWEQDQRVKTLKIAIQCSKLLADTSVIQFYPSKFVLITDILDTFGYLVYERIRQKSAYFPPGIRTPTTLPKNFTPEQVPESAKETCRNWFFKIASIRELIPRLYTEAAILKCYSFLTTGEYAQALLRIANQMRGIGDPLVAIYARTYLCRVSWMSVAPEFKDHLVNNFYDFLGTYVQLQGDSVQNLLAVQRLDMSTYLTLYSPALDWILQCIAYQASDDTLTEILEKCRKQCNSALLLNSIMSAFKPDYIASRVMNFLEMIKECEESGFPKHNLYRSLGINLVLANPPENQRLAVLNDVWKVVMKLKNPNDYISCAEIWIEYPCKHFTKREINTLLGDMIKHMTPDRAFEDYYPQLQSVISKVLAHVTDFSELFSMDKFLPFIDMLQKESVKVEVCKTIMEYYTRSHEGSTSDPVIINALMFVCKTMHDSVNALTVDDEKRVVGNLISSFVRKVSFGRDFEQQLTFYVEARASFSNLESVLIQLVHCVNLLSIETKKIVKGNHSRKTAAFVRACSAYCFITIPSISSIFSRLQLYLVSGQVAMSNQALTQGDAFFKAAIQLISEVPKTVHLDYKSRSTEPLVADYICNFLSVLLIAPDHPDHGALYLIRGLLNVIHDYHWDESSDTKIRLFFNVLNLLSAVAQEQYIYHFDKVDSNDTLYGNDNKFLAEIHKITEKLIEEVLEHCKRLTQTEGLKRQSSLALDFFNHITAHGNVANPKMSTLAQNLWNLAQKHGYADTKMMVRVLEAVKRKAIQEDGEPYNELISKMPLQSRA